MIVRLNHRSRSIWIGRIGRKIHVRGIQLGWCEPSHDGLEDRLTRRCAVVFEWQVAQTQRRRTVQATSENQGMFQVTPPAVFDAFI